MTRDSKLDTLNKRKKKEKTPIYTFSFHVINPFPFHVINPFHTLLSTLLFYIIFNNIQFLKAIATLLMQWSFPSFCTHTYQVSFQSSVLLPFQKIIMASQVLSSPANFLNWKIVQWPIITLPFGVTSSYPTLLKTR